MRGVLSSKRGTDSDPRKVKNLPFALAPTLPCSAANNNETLRMRTAGEAMGWETVVVEEGTASEGRWTRRLTGGTDTGLRGRPQKRPLVRGTDRRRVLDEKHADPARGRRA